MLPMIKLVENYKLSLYFQTSGVILPRKYSLIKVFENRFLYNRGDLRAHTVVAGIAISYGDLKVEIMRPYVVPTGKASRIRNLYFVNGDMVFTDLFVIGPEDPFDLYFRGINLKQEAGGRSLHVWIPGANLCVNIFMARNYLNLYLTLPDSFRGHTRGLVGLFDGRLDNDFKPIGSPLNVSYHFNITSAIFFI